MARHDDGEQVRERLHVSAAADHRRLDDPDRPPDQCGRREGHGEDCHHGEQSGETVDHAGTYYTLERCVIDPPAARPGGPPLMVGPVNRSRAVSSSTGSKVVAPASIRRCT